MTRAQLADAGTADGAAHQRADVWAPVRFPRSRTYQDAYAAAWRAGYAARGQS